LPSTGNEHRPSVEVLVIDEGSTDDTLRQVRREAAFEPEINLGIGGASADGGIDMPRAGYDIAVQVDGEGNIAQEKFAVGEHLVRTGNRRFSCRSRFLGSSDIDEAFRVRAHSPFWLRLIRNCQAARMSAIARRVCGCQSKRDFGLCTLDG